MISKLISTILVLCFTYALPAASLHGRVVDAQQHPLPAAAVALLNAADSSLVKGALSGADGSFVFDQLKAGRYLLSASYSGYARTWAGPVELAETQDLALPDLLFAASQEVEGVEVAVTVPLFVQQPGKLIMNVENSPVNISGSAWDVICKAPGVMVSPDGRLALYGKPGVQVQVDGKSTYLDGAPLKTLLEHISAADVVRIEIMSHPSAKYDAEGAGGIINVVTKKGVQLGFNGSARAGFGEGLTPKYEAGLTFNYAREKFNLYGNYDFSNENGIDQRYITRTDLQDGVTTTLTQQSRKYATSFVNRAKLGVDIYAKHGITWGTQLNGNSESDVIHTPFVSAVTSTASDSVLRLDQLARITGLYNDGSATAYFNWDIDTTGRKLSASADYLAYDYGDNSFYDVRFSGDVAPGTQPLFQRNQTLAEISIYAGQLDYTHPLGKKYKLETGVKNSLVKSEDDILFSVLDSGGWQKDARHSNHFIYTEQVNAAYLNATADYGKCQLEAGLRVEQTNSDGRSPVTLEEVKRTYTQLFPSAGFTQKIGEKQMLNGQFSRRINRPDYSELNPFMNYLDQYTYAVGNPFLDPEIENSAAFTWSYADTYFVTLSAGRVNHAMTAIWLLVDSSNVSYRTMLNFDHADNAALSVSFPINICKWLVLENSWSAAYNGYKTVFFGAPVDNRKISCNGSSTATFSLLHDWKLQLSGSYVSPIIYGVVRIRSMGSADIGVSKAFCENKLHLDINASDLFRTNGTRVITDFRDEHMFLNFNGETRTVYIRLRYNFGNAKATRKVEDGDGAEDLKRRAGG